jgi:hypothetical protein
MTITGIILIPLYVLVICCPWRYIVVVLVLSALLSDAAVVNIGSVGIQPGFFFMLLVISRTVVDILARNQHLNGYVLRSMAPLGFLMVVSTLILLIAVIFFEGRVTVGSPTLELDQAGPYAFRRENIAQLTYLLIDIMVVYCLAHQAGRMRLGVFAKASEAGLVTAGFLSAGVCFWQMAQFYLSVPFPFDFFHSNVGYIPAYGQMIAGVPRISGPFPEPSSLGYVFGGLIQFAWQRHRFSPTPWSFGLLLVCIATLAISTSTTSYGALAFFLMILVKDLGFGRRSIASGLVKWRKRELALIFLLLVGAGVVGAYVSIEGRTLQDVLDIELFEKDRSSSFDQRIGADLIAWNIVKQTMGIGIGLGSHRPNSLVMTLLSNVGLLGTFIFCFFVLRLIRMGQNTKQVAIGGALRQSRWFVIGLLAMGVLSGTTLTIAILWTGFALVLGVSVESRRVARSELRSSREIGLARAERVQFHASAPTEGAST